ncbi:hypothetical protein NWF34_22560 [Gordonia sp. GONU]|nr:hypothetical protein [Gordonia sp. GONU]MCR8899721.1 hypothetical protein [Gordonia sp. GONU]
MTGDVVDAAKPACALLAQVGPALRGLAPVDDRRVGDHAVAGRADAQADVGVLAVHALHDGARGVQRGTAIHRQHSRHTHDAVESVEPDLIESVTQQHLDEAHPIDVGPALGRQW